MPQVVLGFELRVTIKALDHLLPLDVEAGIQGHVGREKGLLVFVVDLLVGLLAGV